jgi:hypothetical protein
MPSRKKAAGKARKAAKAKAKEETQSVSANQEVDLIVRRLELEDLLRECEHGLARHNKNEKDFCLGFFKAFEDANRRRVSGLDELFNTTLETMQENFAAEMQDVAKMEAAVAYFLYGRTQLILEEGCNSRPARKFASFSSYLKQNLAVNYYKSQPVLDSLKLAELTWADDHTLVSFFRKGIPCSCLDEKYKQVKSITKIGLCCYPKCSRPNRIAERKTLQYCARCREANYCSRDCKWLIGPGTKTYVANGQS